MYSINKFSKLLNVTPQTLRNWHKSGYLIPFTTSTNGYRYYSEQQLKQFTDTPTQPVNEINKSSDKIINESTN